MDALEVGWMAGVLESKGSLEIDKRGGIRIRVRSGNKWLLNRVATLADGKVNKAQDLATVSGYHAAHVLHMTFMVLGPDKRAKARLLMREYNGSLSGKRFPVLIPIDFAG